MTDTMAKLSGEFNKNRLIPSVVYLQKDIQIREFKKLF